MKKTLILVLVALFTASPVFATFLGNPTKVTNGGTGLASIPTVGQVLIGNGTGYSLSALSGDVTMNSSGVTSIGSGKVVNSMLANMGANTFKGNNTGGSAAPLDLTGTQATALLDVFSSTLKGLAPASGGGTANFLRADGTWAAPAGSSPLTTKGDIFAFSTANDRLPVGTNGQILTPNSSASTGLNWVTTLPTAAVPGFTGGDVTSSAGSLSLSIANSSVSNAKMANMAANTFKANNTASPAAPSDITGTQATALLSDFVGDSGSGGTKGLVPAPASGDAAAGKVLKADGTWGSAGTTSPLTTKGDLYGFSTTNDRLPVGTNGQILTPNSSASTGLNWVTTLPTAAVPGFTGGDVTSSAGSLSLSLGNSTVTNAKLANMAANTIKGNNTAGSAAPVDLTGTQTTALLDTFTSTLKGLAPASGGGTANYLRADGTWATPPNSVSGTTRSITQNSHGFAVGDLIYYTGSAYAKAQANADSTSEVLGIVSAVTDLNTFTLTSEGYVTGLSGLTPGSTYYLSAATAGAATATAPGAFGNINKPVYVAVSATTANIIQSRGYVVGGNGSQINSNSRVSGAGGNGSSGTKVRYFSTVQTSPGSDITYTPSSVNGDSWTVNIASNYSIVYCDMFNTQINFAITKNQSSLTTSPYALSPYSQVLALGVTAAADISSCVAWSGPLAAGDVIRAGADAATTGVAPARAIFSIANIGANTASVSGAQMQGYVYADGKTSCSWQLSGSTSTWNDYSADADCNTSTAVGSAVSAPGTKIPAIVVNITDASLYYKFTATARFENSGSGSGCGWRFSDGTDSSLPYVTGSGSVGNTTEGQISGLIKFSSTGLKTVKIQERGIGGSANCYITNDNSGSESFAIYVNSYTIP